MAPAVFGGLCRCGVDGARFTYEVMPVSKKIRVVLLIPPEIAETEVMRRVVPECFSKEDQAHNQKMQDGLLTGLASGDPKGLTCSQQDRRHQPHRLAVQPQAKRLFELLKQSPEIAGVFLSGSGSTVGGWVLGADPLPNLKRKIAQLPFSVLAKLVEVDYEGATWSIG